MTSDEIPNPETQAVDYPTRTMRVSVDTVVVVGAKQADMEWLAHQHRVIAQEALDAMEALTASVTEDKPLSEADQKKADRHAMTIGAHSLAAKVYVSMGVQLAKAQEPAKRIKIARHL